MRLLDLIKKADGLLEEAFLPKAEIIRTKEDLTKELIPINLEKALAGDSSENVYLQNLDQVKIYSIHDFRQPEFVYILGEVNKPGKYELIDSMTVADLILQAGGFTDRASPAETIEVYRLDTTEVYRFSRAHKVKVPILLENIEAAQKFYLKKYDQVVIRRNPAFNLSPFVKIAGEVYYPGIYPIVHYRTRISDILEKAGGVKKDAYIEGFKFFREGKLVYLDLKKILKHPQKTKYDIILMDGDSLYIPQNSYIVKVYGEVLTPVSVLFQKGKGIKFYLEQAGGLKDTADKKRILVKLPNGRVWQPRRWWFDPPITPGTTIFVPTKSSKENKFWEYTRDIVGIISNVSTMLYLIYNISK